MINIRRYLFLFLASALLTAGLFGARSFAEEDQLEIESVLPPETLLFFQLPDGKAQAPAYEKSVLRQVAGHPEVAAFLTGYQDAKSKFIQQVAEVAKLEPAFIASLLSGQLSGAILDVSEDQNGQVDFTSLMAVRLAQEPDQKQLFDAVKALVNKPRDMSNDPIPLKNVAWEEKYAGDHTVLMIAGEKPLRFVLMGRFLLFYRGPSSDGLKAILDRRKDALGAKSLARDPLFKSVYAGAEASGQMGFIYINSSRLYGLLEALRLPRQLRLLDALGLNGVQALGMAGGFQEEGIRHTMYLHAPGERRGILCTLSMLTKAELAAQQLPADAPGILAARADLPSLYREIPRLFDAVEEALGIKTPLGLANLAGKQDILGVPAPELLETLGDAIIIQPGPAGVAIRFDTANCQAFEAVIARMEQTLEAKFTRLPVKTGDGREVVIKYFNRSGQPVPLAPSYCVYRQAGETGVIYFATHPQVLKAIFRQPPMRPLTEATDYKRVSRGMGQGYGVFMYSDSRESYPRVYDAVMPILNVWTAIPSYSADAGLLPPGNELAQYFFGCGMGIKNNPQGITFTTYSPLGFGAVLVYMSDKFLISNPTTLGVIGAKLAEFFGADSGNQPKPLVPRHGTAPSIGGEEIPGIGK
jgi:hypothetical protein